MKTDESYGGPGHMAVERSAAARRNRIQHIWILAQKKSMISWNRGWCKENIIIKTHITWGIALALYAVNNGKIPSRGDFNNSGVMKFCEVFVLTTVTPTVFPWKSEAVEAQKARVGPEQMRRSGKSEENSQKSCILHRNLVHGQHQMGIREVIGEKADWHSLVETIPQGRGRI